MKLLLAIATLVLTSCSASSMSYHLGGTDYLKNLTASAVDEDKSQILIQEANNDQFGILGERTWVAQCFGGNPRVYNCSLSSKEGSRPHCKRDPSKETALKTRFNRWNTLGGLF